jgi:argininosuccinate lyase
VRKGVPFRQAHHAVGRVVAFAEQAGKSIGQLSIEEYQSVDKNFGPDALGVLQLKEALANRDLVGAPGTRQVERQLARWRKLLH